MQVKPEVILEGVRPTLIKRMKRRTFMQCFSLSNVATLLTDGDMSYIIESIIIIHTLQCRLTQDFLNHVYKLEMKKNS